MRVETVTVRILQANIKDFADIVLFENVEKFFRGFFAVTNGEKSRVRLEKRRCRCMLSPWQLQAGGQFFMKNLVPEISQGSLTETAVDFFAGAGDPRRVFQRPAI